MEKDIKEGTLRLLTPGEIALAREVFGHSINYPKVWIHCDSYLPLGLQGKNVGMSPNGEIYFRKEQYSPDFSSMSDFRKQHFYIHEMAHVWQHQKGMWVRMRGLFSWAANYSYKLDVNREINNYSMEQQAQIIADYFILERYGYERWLSERNYTISYNGPADKNIKEKYKAVLKSFFQQR